MRTDEISAPIMKSFCRVRDAARQTFLFSSFFGLTLMLFFLAGCAPSSSTGDAGQGSSGSASADLPELTDDLIRERLNYVSIWEVPEENGTAEPIRWSFHESEPKEIVVADKQIEGSRATIILDIKTGSSAKSRNPRALAGQIRTEWELKTGWALRKWEIVRTENISMKYKNLPKPPAQNSNR